MSKQERFPADWFPFGATLVSTMTRWAHPGQRLAEWVKEADFDLTRMAEHGMTAVGVMMDWELAEPEEGKFDFSRHDPILEKAAKLGLRVVLWPWEEVGPRWIPRDHPDWLWEADDGGRALAGCWHHPAFRDRVHRFLRTVVERYRDNPAMLMWNVAIEPHYRPVWEECIDSRQKIYCYQPATVEKFRRWLKEKNENDLDRLNRRWLSYYTHWDQVVPPRTGSYNFNSPWFYDWRMFWVDALAEYQGRKSDLVRKLDPNHPTTGNSGWFPSPIYAGLGMHKLAAGFDSFGISSFPIYRWGRLSRPAVNLSYNFVHSACHPGKPAILHELQGGPMAHGEIFAETPRPEEIRQWCWQAVGNGYKGIYFWVWRHHRTSTEMGGFGLCNMDGSDTNRTKAAAETCREIQKWAPAIQRLNPIQPKAAILYSDRNIIVEQMASRLGSFNADSHAGSLHTSGVEGYFETFYKLRIPIHLMIEEQLKELIDGNLSHIKALVIPYLPMVTAENLSLLEKFAGRGGLIWTDPWLAQRDDANVGRMHVPGDSLRALFGCTQDDVRPILSDTPQNRQNLWRQSSLVGNGTCRVNLPGKPPIELRSLVHEIPLVPFEGGEVLGVFENGSPALVRKRHGQSAVYYTGSYFGISTEQTYVPTMFAEKQEASGKNIVQTQSGLGGLFKHILSEQGIHPAIEFVGSDQPGMETHLLAGKDEALAIFLNLSSERLSGTWRIRPEFRVDENIRITDLFTGQTIPPVSVGEDFIEIPIDVSCLGVAGVWIAS